MGPAPAHQLALRDAETARRGYKCATKTPWCRSGSGRHLARELDGGRVGVVADAAHVLVGALAAGVDLLGVDTVLGVEVLDLPAGEHTVEASVRLELGAELGGEGEALLLRGARGGPGERVKGAGSAERQAGGALG